MFVGLIIGTNPLETHIQGQTDRQSEGETDRTVHTNGIRGTSRRKSAVDSISDLVSLTLISLHWRHTYTETPAKTNTYSRVRGQLLPEEERVSGRQRLMRKVLSEQKNNRKCGPKRKCNSRVQRMTGRPPQTHSRS